MEYSKFRLADKWHAFWTAAFLVLAFAYMIQIATPLRLTTDSVYYLRMAHSWVTGEGFLYHGEPTHWPPGYPFVVGVFYHLGMATSANLVGLNLVCLLFGLLLVGMILRKRFRFGSTSVLVIICLLLLSHVTVKHVTLPLTDMLFLALFMPGLYLLVCSEETRSPLRWLYIGGALLLAIIATTVRTLGITLFSGVAWAAVSGFVPVVWAHLRRPSRYRIPLLILLVVGGFAVGVVALSLFTQTLYFQQNWAPLVEREGVFGTTAKALDYTFTELGQIFFNLPLSKVPGGLKPAFIIGGILTSALLLCGLLRSATPPSSVEIVTVSFVGILFLWPFTDARLWLPVLPLVFAYGLRALGAIRLRRLPLRPLVYVFIAGQLLTGALALGYSSWITFSGEDFGQRYGSPSFRKSYQEAWQIARESDGKKDNELADLLRLYEPRVRSGKEGR